MNNYEVYKRVETKSIHTDAIWLARKEQESKKERKAVKLGYAYTWQVCEQLGVHAIPLGV